MERNHKNNIKYKNQENKSSDRVGDFRIFKKIASGAFGEIHAAIDESSGKTVAIKLEKRKNVVQLNHEYNVYVNISSKNVNFIPKVYFFSQFRFEDQIVNGMVMELLGPSLHELMDQCGKRLSIKTVLMLGERIVPMIEHFHFKNYIHRDIKPENFVIGMDRNKLDLYIIDFGLAKLFRNPCTFAHVPFMSGKSLTGTARYASLNAHIGLEQGRRDDLEALGYTLIYLVRGKLPWQGLPGKTKQEKYANIKSMKERTTIKELVEGLPSCFEKFLSHIKRLEFDEMPSYLYLKKLFTIALKELRIENDQVYDWMINTGPNKN